MSAGKVYLKGHLVHLALTRVPVNQRTIMEVDKSMATQKEDAASIVSEELAEELEAKEKAELVGKADILVTRAEGKCSKCGKDLVNGKCPEHDKEDKEEKKADLAEEPAVDHFKELSDKLDAVLAAMTEKKSEPAPVPAHALDEYFRQFKSDYDSVILSETSSEDKLHSLQESFNVLAQSIVEIVKSKTAPTVSEGSESTAIKQLTSVVTDLARQVSLISAQLSSTQPKSVLEPPRPRQINPALLQQQSLAAPKSALRSLVERTT